MKHVLLALVLCVAATGFAADFAEITHAELLAVVKAKSAVIFDVNGIFGCFDFGVSHIRSVE